MSDAMTSSITVLPEVVQNQIAAGEVVERPASVVKELAENALDAGATRITVELEDGGRRLIRVIDDGSGMNETDLALCIERHATSKIRDADDLWSIQTMGFRGEALPSIASVAKVSIASAQEGAVQGHELLVEGGKQVRLQPATPRNGTTVTVRDLFFNTPARRKFLKSQAAEVAAVSETLTRLALARPDVSIRLLNGGKTALELPAHGNLAERIGALFGRDVTRALATVHAEPFDGLRVEGFVARPPESRSNSRQLYIFLNDRWIRHPGMIGVIRDVYRGQLPPRRFPFGVLKMTLDPAQVDVNVHPTKEEVRFENERSVVGSIRRAVDEALLLSAPGGLSVSNEPEPRKALPAPSCNHPAARAAESGVIYSQAPRPRSFIPEPTRRAAPSASAQVRATASPIPNSMRKPAQSALPQTQQPKHRVLAQAGNRYLVVEGPDGIVLVDQHALHERWNYEQLLNRDSATASQTMLLPVVVELAPSESALLDVALPLLQEMGFAAESFGTASLSISAAPTFIKPKTVAQLIRDLFQDLAGAKHAVKELREHMLASLACRAAVLFGQTLPHAQLVALLDRFADADRPLTCPHGRPTSYAITWDELDRRFGRA